MSKHVGKRWIEVKRPYIHAHVLMSGGRTDAQNCTKGTIELIRVVKYPGKRSWSVQHKGKDVCGPFTGPTTAMKAAEDYLKTV